MKQSVWMEITKDKYELPVIVASTAEELAILCGTTRNNVMSGACKGRKGLYKSRFVIVEIQEDEEADADGR